MVQNTSGVNKMVICEQLRQPERRMIAGRVSGSMLCELSTGIKLAPGEARFT